MTKAAFVFEDIELKAGQTALVVMHCWNIGCSDGPDIEDNYWVGMGFPEVHRESVRIMENFIRPAMDAARKARIMVCHVESSTIKDNRERKGRNPIPGKLEAEARNWRERIAWRSHGRSYETMSPLRGMDRASIAKAEPGEPLVYSTRDLHNLLRSEGVNSLIYCGFATDMCILRSPGGVEEMADLNYRLFLLRDATLGVEFPDTIDERLSTRWGIRFFESHFGDSLETDDFISACETIYRN